MDPLTALGLASNIIQFVHFSIKLINSSVEIARSAAGATASNVEVENICTRLDAFTYQLTASNVQPGPQQGVGPALRADELEYAARMRPHMNAITEIAGDCRSVNQELLNVVNGLRMEPTASNRRLRAVGVSLKTAFKAKTMGD